VRRGRTPIEPGYVLPEKPSTKTTDAVKFARERLRFEPDGEQNGLARRPAGHRAVYAAVGEIDVMAAKAVHRAIAFRAA